MSKPHLKIISKTRVKKKSQRIVLCISVYYSKFAFYLHLFVVKEEMPCQALCSMNLSLLQQRYIFRWLMASISLLENTADLHRVTLESPWPGYEPEITRKMISDFTDLLAKTHFKIRGLKSAIATGCQLCSSRQNQEQ